MEQNDQIVNFTYFSNAYKNVFDEICSKIRVENLIGKEHDRSIEIMSLDSEDEEENKIIKNLEEENKQERLKLKKLFIDNLLGELGVMFLMMSGCGTQMVEEAIKLGSKNYHVDFDDEVPFNGIHELLIGMENAGPLLAWKIGI